MDFPARGIIRGRWEIGDYRFNLALAPTIFAGPEIVQVAPAQLKAYPWHGAVLDSLPPDVRAVQDEDIKRVQDEARGLVRAQALSRAQHVTLSARSISDIAHVNRVEGLAIGDGLSKQLGAGLVGVVRARYGIDDRAAKGSAMLTWTRPSGFGVRLFGLHDFRDVGDEAERSSVVNSLAAQEFGSDHTDPYLARGAGAGLDFPTAMGFRIQLTGAVEQQDSLTVHGRPVVGRYAPTAPVPSRRLGRLSIDADRPPGLWAFGTELAMHAELRGTSDFRATTGTAGSVETLRTVRAAMSAQLERPVGVYRWVSHTLLGAVATSSFDPEQELFYLGGTITAPGYDYHSLVARAALSQHLEWQISVPFPAFSLGRFGSVPASATIAPFVHAALLKQPNCDLVVPPTGTFARPITLPGASPPSSRSCTVGQSADGAYPAFGMGFLLPFNVVRADVARGIGRGGRWTFSVDISREFWSIF